jgi:hypothetical protein
VAKRTFGTVDELPSGRFRARYRSPDRRRHAKVFGTKADAWAWLATQQTHLLRKTWRAPTASRRTVGDYAEDYLARNDLRASTRILYAGLWRHHLAEAWGDVLVEEVTPAAVRSWHVKAGRTTGPTAVAQFYRLLRAILNVAVADEAIASNRCRLRGAGTPRPSRRSRALTATEALQLAEQLGRDRGPLATAHCCSSSPSAGSGSARPRPRAGPTSCPAAGCGSSARCGASAASGWSAPPRPTQGIGP